jgi:predicted RNase H-like HicB family nuclease
MIYAVIYEHGPNEEGRETWSAYVPDLPGCVSGGDTREECEAMIREAITFHLEGLREEGLPIPAPISEAGHVEVVSAA